ncbi:MAG TPA: protein-L-isoaspartate(D-aspartate) O-methyltransferase [Steroidobacteraceae bacterium]|nr:protein-L-isoaspartate(D-aspartate) O-methyltransferase [Steroidobacteraceae bacterium]
MLRQLLHSVASETARESMVREQIAARGIRDARVLEVMGRVPRHLFVPEAESERAYADAPVPIGQGQTISQPYIVALMTELVRPQSSDRVLEVGTGSGYQAAVLAQLVAHVYTIELEAALGRRAETLLAEQKYANVTVRVGDGYGGWPEHAPFDIIIVTAAPEHVPQPLVDQLKPGGRLIVPVGPRFTVQQLQLLEKDAAGEVYTRNVSPVMFVPMRRP